MSTARVTLGVALALSVGAIGCATPRPTLEPGDDFGASAPAAAGADQPWSRSDRDPVLEPRRVETWPAPPGERGGHGNIAEFGYRIYSRYITKIDGAQCEHRPTCSRFALESVRKHGLLVGAWMATDRLLRGAESSSLRGLPLEKIEDGRPYFSDPVEENDFFF